MTQPAAPPRGRYRPLTRLARLTTTFGAACEGASAVEFAFIAPPFLALLFAIFEIGLTMLVTQNLNAQLTSASRLIYTGEFQGSAGNKNADATTILKNLRTALCQANGKALPSLFDCSAVKLNVLAVSSFASAVTSPTVYDPVKGKLVWNSSFGSQYACGHGNEIIVVQAAVEYPVFLSQLYAPASLLENGRRVVQAAAAFRVEPLNTNPCS
ncbi:TadE/TadG family type IV pilus assembly protein [Methylobacterium segetis]|uniref:TadE/TadG family type IV pilus assembly protein n=1 Tax=Methylobacterium segetis TaxID=2488750 RepID=UPI00104473D5|nr:TadE/TadG family type IV pilus assembly protein [Methylobacterium segetis]